MRKLRKLLLAGVVAAALAVPAPTLAIHDGAMPFVSDCADGPGNSQAIGQPATGKANTAFSNTVLNPLFLAKSPPPCHFD
jgi:hypothetical protein